MPPARCGSVPIRKSARVYPDADLITPLTLQDGIQADEQFAEHTAACDHEGRIYIGELEKIYGFHPDSFADSDKGMNLQIVSFEIDERPIVPSTEPNAPLQVAISEAQEVRIGAGYHLFGFEFAAVNCRMQRHVRYQHILEGYDKDWTDDRGTHQNALCQHSGRHLSLSGTGVRAAIDPERTTSERFGSSSNHRSGHHGAV